MKKYFKLIIIIVIIILFFVTYFIENNKEEVVSEPEVVMPIVDLDKEQIIETIKVEIKGEVISPGVYDLPQNSRVIDLINISGGLTENAVLTNINQAKKLTDEMVVIIYNQNDLIEEVKTEYVYLECTCPEVKNDACIDEKKDNNIENNKISINTATIEELMTINGIGEKTANKIIEYRKETLFEKIEDLKNVSGIGDSLYEKVKDFITI